MASGSNGWPASADHHSANAWKELHSLSQLDGMQQHCGGVLLQQHQQQQHDKQPSWLMPWQTGNRQAGEKPMLAALLAGTFMKRNLQTPEQHADMICRGPSSQESTALD
jgi:hypothetical protein